MRTEPSMRGKLPPERNPFTAQIEEAYDALLALRREDPRREGFERRLDEARLAPIEYQTAWEEGFEEGLAEAGRVPLPEAETERRRRKIVSI